MPPNRSAFALSPRRVLFLQCVNAGQYPPIIHAAQLMADDGWLVHLLSSPDTTTASLRVAPFCGLVQHATRIRPQNAVRLHEYCEFTTRAILLSCRLRPRIVYASDFLACGPGLACARLSGAALVYHEHDTPGGSLRPSFAWLRAAAIKRAKIVILPNSERGRLVCGDDEQTHSKLRIVWNVPRINEIPPPAAKDDKILKLYFHGSITPDRLPLAVIEAICRFNGRIKLVVAGYEVPGAPGYLAKVLALGSAAGNPLVTYLGQIPTRKDLLRAACGADVGLAFMPKMSDDINMRHMVGASNKPFDYMAAGLALLVSDLPDWVTTYSARGFGRCCDPSSAESVAAALSWFLHHPSERQSMGELGRQMIRDKWNYESAFASILEEFEPL